MSDTADNPLSAVTTIVKTGLTVDPLIAALIPESRVQVWDRPVDVRGDMEADKELGRRIWIIPRRHTTNLGWSSGSALFVRRYEIGYAAGDLKLIECERLEWLIIRAATLMSNKQLPQEPGTQEPPLPSSKAMTDPSPLQIEAIGLEDTDPQREPLETPEEWRGVITLVVTLKGPRADILTWGTDDE